MGMNKYLVWILFKAYIRSTSSTSDLRRPVIDLSIYSWSSSPHLSGSLMWPTSKYVWQGETYMHWVRWAYNVGKSGNEGIKHSILIGTIGRMLFELRPEFILWNKFNTHVGTPFQVKHYSYSIVYKISSNHI